MTVKTGTVWTGTFVCLDSTGALSTPSVGPVGALWLNGAANGASVTISGTNPYGWSVTIPTVTAGQRVSMYVTATIATIATAAVVAEESADTSLASDIKTDTAAILADTGTDGVVLAADAVAEIADAVWDELIAGHTTTGSMADELSDVDEDVWGYATRTLTASAAATTSTVSGSSITATRGDTLTASLTALGNISSRSKLWFTVKEETEDADSASIVQIEETLGLLYINGAAAGTAANGSITVTDATTGALTITLKPAETDDLAVGQYKYDIQQLTSGGVVTTLTSGIFEVVADITKAVA